LLGKRVERRSAVKGGYVTSSIFLWAFLIIRPSCSILPQEPGGDPGLPDEDEERAAGEAAGAPEIREAHAMLTSVTAAMVRRISMMSDAGHTLRVSKVKKKGGIKIPSSETSETVIENVRPGLEKELKKKALAYGSPIFIRVFKESSEMELWIRRKGGVFVLFKVYSVCAFSGGLGPKTMQGDGQSPEGFYFVRPLDLRPSTRFYLAFFINYPNTYDRAHGRTGGEIMVHGRCVSIGCYSMADHDIEEIYALADGAFRGGQVFFRVHIFPFRMTEGNMKAHPSPEWMEFWTNLREGYDYFETKSVPPNVVVAGGRYAFEDDA
jgi:murein L,D-transpeptidase YafK